DEVWVAAGVYTSAANPVVAMKAGVAIYGGFAGVETERTQRNWTSNVTTIDGENARRCVTGANGAVLDGFTVTRGRALFVSSIFDCRGGGMFNDNASPTVANCIFQNNAAVDWDPGGGAIFNQYASPTISNCQFINNAAAGYSAGSGGAIFNYSCGSIAITSCAFSGNTALSSGGAITNNESTATITNCLFSGNSSDDYGGGAISNTLSSVTSVNSVFFNNSSFFGGGVRNIGASLTAVNCSFSGNTAVNDGGGIYNAYESSAVLTNCILWGNAAASGPEFFDSSSTTTATYSCIGGGYAGEGNIAVDPLFMNAGAGDLGLQPSSPCRDAGTADGAPDYDILGTPRPQGGGHDMGAYEYTTSALEVYALSSVSAQVEIGGMATFAVGVTGSTGVLSYQWYRQNSDKDLSLIPDAVESSYTVYNVSEADLGYYQCEVYDDGRGETVWSPLFRIVLSGSMPAAGMSGLLVIATALALMGTLATIKQRQ
ncbi:MAG TPA: hypothetical protein ENN29_08865, partial [Candidatus Hydrogenedentes bacterium]|nr:hypothetical protein [Candidatus Hydrogenedentota bacterium]